MALYLDNQDGAYAFYGSAPRKVVVAGQQAPATTNNDGTGYPMAVEPENSYASFPAETTSNDMPLDLSTVGTSGYPQTTTGNSALASLQGMSASPYKIEKFFSKEDKTLFKGIHGTEQELATHVQSLRQTVDAMGKIDAQNQELTQTLAQLHDGIRQLQQAASNPAYASQHTQIQTKLAQLNQQKQDAERTKARLTEERATHMEELTAAKEATKEQADAYLTQMNAVMAAHTEIKNKAKTEKGKLDANSVDKAPYLLKQSGAMKKTLNLIAQAVDEVEDIENGQMAPVLNTENDPTPVEAETTDTTAEEAEAQGKAVNDVLGHLKGVAEKKGGLTHKDLDKIKTYLEKDGNYTLDDEDLRKSIKPLVSGENKLSEEGKETYIKTLEYLDTHFNAVSVAQTWDHLGWNADIITAKDLGAVLNEDTEALEKLKKDLGGAVGVTPESSTEDTTESEASELTGGEMAGGLAAAGATAYGMNRLRKKFGKQAGAAAKSATKTVSQSVSQSKPAQRMGQAVRNLKSKITGEPLARTGTRLEPILEKASAPGMDKQLKIADGDFTLKNGTDTTSNSKASTPATAKPTATSTGIEKQLKIADGDFTLKKGADTTSKAVKSTPQQPITEKIEHQLAKKAQQRTLGSRPTPPPKVGANSRMATIMSRGTGFMAKAGSLLGGKLNMWMMGVSVIMGVASQAGVMPGQNAESVIPDA